MGCLCCRIQAQGTTDGSGRIRGSKWMWCRAFSAKFSNACLDARGENPWHALASSVCAHYRRIVEIPVACFALHPFERKSCMTQTPLDLAHVAMQAAPDDDAMRLRFFERLGDAELFMLLEGEPVGEAVTPQIFDPGTGSIVLVFDREERLTQFVGAEAPYAALSGRLIVGLLAEQGLGLGLNLDVAPSSFLLDSDGVQWLAQTLGHGPDEIEARLDEISAPTGLPDTLLTALDAKLATATGLAQMAYLVASVDSEGKRSHLLAVVGAASEAEAALARAAS